MTSSKKHIYDVFGSVAHAARPSNFSQAFQLSGSYVTLHFGGAEEQHVLSRAFLHLSRLDEALAEGSHNVYIRTCAQQGTEEVLSAARELLTETESELFVGHHEQYHFVIQHAPLSVSVFSREQRIAWYFLESIEQLNRQERATPLRFVLSELLAGQGCRILHAAGVGRGENGLLIPGASGCGKSTMALACAQAGWSYAGDDMCAVNLRENTIQSIYNSAKVTPENKSNFPSLFDEAPSDQQSEAINEKSVVYLHQSSIAFGIDLNIRAIIFPSVDKDGRFITLKAMSAGEALRRLISTNLCFLPGLNSSADVALLAKLSRSVPAYSISLNQNIRGIPAVLEALINPPTRPQHKEHAI